MALPTNTEFIIRFLRTEEPNSDYFVALKDGEAFLTWLAATTEPTEQEIIDAGNDLTTVNGQVFSVWLAEHGGDPILTARRQAKAALDEQRSDIKQLVRAVVVLTKNEINLHSLKINAILDAIDGAANLAQVKSAVAAIPDLAERTPAQIRNAIFTIIDAGDADT